MDEIDEILMIPVDDWTSEQTKKIKKAIKDGIVCVKRQSLWDTIVPLPDYEPVIPFTAVDARPDDCLIQRFFRDNPNARSCAIACPCRMCSVQCAVTPAFQGVATF